MIPRTKANYTFRQLLSAAFVTERSHDCCRDLESELQRLLGCPNVLLTASGRGALYLLLKALRRPRVVIPSYTCKAVVEAVLLAGCDPVFAEAEEDGFNTPANELAKVVDSDCVVVATHQFGIPCEIRETAKLCRARSAVLIEDAAAALGTKIDGQWAGTFGDAAFFSFDSTKLVTVPMKGGAIVARDADLLARVAAVRQQECARMSSAHKLWLLANAAVLLLLENHFLYGLFHLLYFRARRRFTTDHSELRPARVAFYRHELANWQASLALPQVRNLECLIHTRQQLYERLRKGLEGCRSFQLPPADPNREWACIRFPIRVRGDKLAFYRRAVVHGLDFAFSFTFLGCGKEQIRAQRLAQAVLDPPFYAKLGDREVDRVIEILRRLDSEMPA